MTCQDRPDSASVCAALSGLSATRTEVEAEARAAEAFSEWRVTRSQTNQLLNGTQGSGPGRAHSSVANASSFAAQFRVH